MKWGDLEAVLPPRKTLLTVGRSACSTHGAFVFQFGECESPEFELFLHSQEMSLSVLSPEVKEIFALIINMNNEIHTTR